MEMFYILNHWHWWALAALLLFGEMLGPCAWFLALSVAALLVGLVTKFVPQMPGLWQLGLFVGLSAITLILAHRTREKRTRAAAASQQE
jgi:inner membrane protein